MGVVRVIVILLRAFLLPRAALGAENLVLRQQLGILQRSVKRPRLRRRDRILWVWLSRLWADWHSGLVADPPPETWSNVHNALVHGHRGFPGGDTRAAPRATDNQRSRRNLRAE